MENDVQREDEKNLPDKEKHNRLFKENSPYLLQHSTNPVDWYPWGEEAFEQARKEDKPIFLSAGYSTCHWCHVMERESFERDDVAEIMNSRYVSIKVDREERPDIDEIYMAATQLMTGRGGWPNSVWLTPDGKPWYAGTYFPREDVGAMAGFKTMLLKLAEVWQTRKEEALAQADKISSTIEQISRGRAPTSGGGISRELVAGAIEQMKQNYDGENGGFGKAPKFPPHPSLKLLFYEHGRTGDKDSLDMADAILEAMASGGIRDHIGGGFHRYSTDEKWFLPHFEKMLYDNAQLLRAYTIGFLLVGRESYKRVAGEIAEWVLDEMSDPEGGFYGAIDADSEGEEGKHYVWKKDEIIEILGEEDGEIFCRIYGIENEGNYLDEATGARPGTNVIYMKESPGNELVGKIQSMKKKLLKERKTRPRPHLDEKIIAGWNGLMLGSLAYAGSALGMPEYIETAQRAGEFIFEKMYDNGRLKRYRREGRTGSVAFLDDYAFCAEGLLELHEAAGEERWLRECKKLMDTLIGHYIDRGAGGFFFTSDEHEKLIIRPKSLHDRALPSGNGVALGVLVRLHEKTGDGKYLEIVQSSLKSFLPEMKTSPGTVQTIIHAAGLYLDSQNEKVS